MANADKKYGNKDRRKTWISTSDNETQNTSGQSANTAAEFHCLQSSFVLKIKL